MHELCRQIHLLLCFHRTRPGDDLNLVAAQLDARNIDDGIFLMRFARHDFVLFGDMHRRFHARQRREHFFAQRTLITDRADYRALNAARNIGLQSGRFKFLDHCADLRVSDIFSHYDNHYFSPPLREF